MQNIAPNTLFTGRQLVFLPECDSTNSYAHELLIKNKATEGCVVITNSQTRGRGQRGNSWEAEPGKNITLSVILKPGFVAVHQQFYLTVFVSLAVLDLARTFLPSAPKIKWPNDLYYGNKKIGGILIENSVSGQFLQHSIIGIGLNINQLSFANATASSFAQITNQTFRLEQVVERLLEHLEARYLELKQGKQAKLKFEYLQHLFRYQEPHPFLVNGKEITGIIIGVDDAGKLCLQVGQEVRYFDLKEINFIL